MPRAGVKNLCLRPLRGKKGFPVRPTKTGQGQDSVSATHLLDGGSPRTAFPYALDPTIEPKATVPGYPFWKPLYSRSRKSALSPVPDGRWLRVATKYDLPRHAPPNHRSLIGCTIAKGCRDHFPVTCYYRDWSSTPTHAPLKNLLDPPES